MILELKNIKKHFPVKHQGMSVIRAVDNVSLSIKAGENLGLVGESGSGKSTLARVIMRLYKPDEGFMLLEGEDITTLSYKKLFALRRSIQMVFQDPYSSLDPRFTVYGILKEADQLISGAEGRQGRMEAILKEVGLNTACLRRYPHEFSGGERQRIAIARALIMNPKLVVLDEAVSSLDVLIQEQILKLLRRLQEERKCTYLFISHNLRVVKKICSKIAVMYKGKIIELADKDELFKNPLHDYTKELLSAAITYTYHKRVLDFPLSENSSLIDRGHGHFVIN